MPGQATSNQSFTPSTSARRHPSSSPHALGGDAKNTLIKRSAPAAGGGRLGVRKMSTKSDASYRHRVGELKEKESPITEVDRVHQQPLRRPKPQR